mmetsp:Transcript_22784/g.52045  ORF Transcript_22784/g.52045 Transcript_22784/m.52045 type:complete len:719 (-) Transcript_22784:43-2199(-)
MALVTQSATVQKQAEMLQLGLHVLNPTWQKGRVGGKEYSTSFKECTLQLYGTDETYKLPVQTCTRVGDVREALGNVVLDDTSRVKFLVKQGCSTRILSDTDEVATKMTVKGLKSFKPVPKVWPHPIGIIGTGYHGLKTAMAYAKAGNFNFVSFDRNDRVGGYCWITGANKTSKLQTEFGSFHVWWGPDYLETGKCGGLPGGNENSQWSMWPHKAEILKHFQLAAEEYGVLPYVRFSSNVSKLDIVGQADDESRYYNLTVESLKGGSTEVLPVSVIYNYPGSLTKNRIIDYPGEDEFDGHVRYGMGDDTPYDKLTGCNIAILGNGAFAVENARTCIESGSHKAYIITRRKNLASPRCPCWFVHQGPAPTPGPLVMKYFEPMYELVGFGDPWSFWSVFASSDRSKCSIVQNSRFGIGDITFLMCAWGRLEYVVDTVKRMTRHTLHLTSGAKIENVQIVLKALGLLGDFEVDKLHSMKEMVGSFCSGDWRRVLMIDATGMNAANFTTFSTGIGTHGFVTENKYFHDYPKEMYKLMSMGLMQQLPRHKAEEQYDKPAYVTEVKFAMTTGMMIHMMYPRMAQLTMDTQMYKYRMYHGAHNVDRLLKTCTDEWFGYQKEWAAKGYDLKSSPIYKEEWGTEVPYPYTRQMMSTWFKEYSDWVGWPISIEGPKEDEQPPGPGGVTGPVTQEALNGIMDSDFNTSWWASRMPRNSRCHGGMPAAPRQ